MRILSYRTIENVIDGIVKTLNDITKITGRLMHKESSIGCFLRTAIQHDDYSP